MSTLTSNPIAAHARAVTLRVTDPTFRASHVPLEGTRVVIGRADDAEVLLDSQTVSRHHAELVRDPFDRWWVRDLGSRNGTRVNGAKVVESVVGPGDVLEIGGYTLSLAAPAPELGAADTQTTYFAPVDDRGGGGRISRLREYAPPRIEAAQLSAVTEFGHQLNVMQDEAERLRRLCRLMTGPEFHGHVALILRVNRGDPSRPQVLCGPENSALWQGDAPPISRGVLRSICDVPEPVLATNAAAVPDRVELSISADVMAITVIAAPIRFDERVVDLLYTVLAPEYGHGDWLALAALAVKQFQQAEAVWLNFAKIREYAAVARELEVAQRIQLRLIPRDVRIAGVGLSIGFRPCRWVGGDYADVVPLPDGRVLLVVADVCGKGLPAALITSSLHTMVHANVRAGKSARSMADALNEYLGQYLGDGSFVTMICLAFDPSTGAFECVNAGHPPGIFITPAGDVRMMDTGANPPLGIGADLIPDAGGVLAEGELLVLFTDGLSEASNDRDDMLGLDGLGNALRDIYTEHAQAPVGELGDRVTEWLDRYETGRMASDDRTFMLVRLDR